MTIKTESDISLPGTIPQKPDIVLERILPYLMNCLTFRLNQLLNQDLRKLGLTISNWRILAVLDVNETASINELVEYAMIEQSTVSRLISRMEEDGLVRRDRIDEDGRVAFHGADIVKTYFVDNWEQVRVFDSTLSR